MTHSVFIIDDHKIVRDGLKAMLLGYPEYSILGEAATGAEALEKLKTNSPDIVFVDLRLPDCNGAALIADILKVAPKARCILLTGEPNALDLQRAISTGARGFLTKEIDTEEYIRALNAVSGGGKYITQSFSHLLLDEKTMLTSREMEVLTLFAEGLPYKQIAGKLEISPRTVETHKNNILEKLAVDTPIEMVRKAIKLGLIKA